MWSTQRQQHADFLDQLDFALDQLFVRDRNHDRFAIMLIDNVMELALHSHAISIANERRFGAQPELSEDLVVSAKGRRFDAKVKLAKATGLLSDDQAGAVNALHEFRNTAHHAGLRHERILNPLAAFYLHTACAVLASNKRGNIWFSSSTLDVLPRRAVKYIGQSASIDSADWREVWNRLRSIAEPLVEPLVLALAEDAEAMVEAADWALSFLANDGFKKTTREEALVEAQVAALWSTPEVQRRLSAASEEAQQGRVMAATLAWLETRPDASASIQRPPGDVAAMGFGRRVIGIEP